MALAMTARPELRVHIHHDERAASFMALGLGLSSGRPAPVLCTSGTAAAEMHPAVVEADLSGVPMLVLTADRPPELRDVGAPQTIDQTHLYGRATRWFAEPGPPTADSVGSWRSLASRAFIESIGGRRAAGPVHLNLAFREPLVGTPAALPDGREGGAPWHRSAALRLGLASEEVTSLARGLSVEDGLILAGAGAGGAPGAVHDLAEALGWPILADARSGIGDGPNVVRHADSILRASDGEDLGASTVLRLGPPSASKVLATWLGSRGDLREVVVHDGPGRSDPTGTASLTIDASPEAVVPALLAEVRAHGPERRPGFGRLADAWQAAEAKARRAIGSVLDEEAAPTEPGVARTVARAATDGDTIVVSSSMPFRDLEWFGGPSSARVLSNRGANGIDGVVATAVGVALDAAGRAAGGRTIALVGDVAFSTLR